MRCLITGGAGFIGSHLAEYLLDRNDEVFAIDDLSTGSIENIDHLRRRSRFHYVTDDVISSPILSEMIDRADMIFHLAAAVGVRRVVESPVRTIETNVRGTEKVLQMAAPKRKKVLIASTSEVYGKSERIPFRESDDLIIGPPQKGRWSYACSKVLDESLGLAYWREQRVPVVIVRMFNTVGPRQTGRYGMVLPTFIRQAMTGVPITVFGDGKQVRCFAYVADVVEALSNLARADEAAGEVFNLGSDEPVTILELACRVRVRLGSNSEIAFIRYEEAYGAGFEDMVKRIPSLDKISRLIGYRPRTRLDQIIERVAECERRSGVAPALNVAGVSAPRRS